MEVLKEARIIITEQIIDEIKPSNRRCITSIVEETEADCMPIKCENKLFIKFYLPMTILAVTVLVLGIFRVKLFPKLKQDLIDLHEFVFDSDENDKY